MTIHIRNEFDVEVVDYGGSDELICKAARVSTLGAESINSSESAGLINFLMKNRHGSPFEHGMMMFRISCPIFVWREFMRHRVGFSYNEESGRYKELSPNFYIPPRNRNFVQEGKPGQYAFVPGSVEQYETLYASLEASFIVAWDAYQLQLNRGIAKEVARMCLPVSVYSSAYVTCNPRSMMHFLSLRTKNDDAKFPSFPQWEISQVAAEMESHFSRLFPLTHDAFYSNGRVSP